MNDIAYIEYTNTQYQLRNVTNISHLADTVTEIVGKYMPCEWNDFRDLFVDSIKEKIIELAEVKDVNSLNGIQTTNELACFIVGINTYSIQ
jgi:hypothetical protein